ncbi:hypothetical protein KTG68_15265 [Acinetobacter variabilis]|uniref:Uncharacterized protein n=1 Tax=Acinetobacter variabilis TaxID=70346 RepID=N8VEQ9_9GAMM|nr:MULTISPECIES: hypothetical protein [Acinetobacter]AUX89076.1 hypothetical protein C3F22_04025 [Acinetobacter sp. ACNIH1]ENU98446.1 hypothetical protein F969_02477 [Acinetobacter variabilis]MCU4313297.1 hypothetical protein [Acinetobacter variabilis]MCU4366527.1 hypothetical protein [Acinetobacter variabilis]MCU4376588.1 hypothetical protein [Acinetobacter variabilis]
MPPLDEYAVNPQEIKQGVVALKKRQRNLMLLGLTTSTVCIASVIGLFFQQELVYGFFGLSTQLQQLHLPVSVDANLASIGDSPDYFFALLSWFGWLILKIFASFIGAFFLVGLLKKFGFFYVRFQSFILKFVGWLISFIVIWSGLTYWQYDLRNDREDVYQQVVYYDSNINDSEVARYLVDSDIASPVKSYLLAQTALLHKPVDLSAARPYVAQVVEAERQDNKFEQYGFKPEQIWTMQQQVYGKSLTPLAQSVDRQAQQAEQVSKITNVIIIGIAILFTLLSLIIFVLANSIKGRSLRIEQRIF